MEKICIVKRRKNTPHEFGKEETYAMLNNLGIQRKEDPAFEEPDGGKDHALSFNLTPEQSELIRSNGHINSLLTGTANSPFLDTQRNENGQIIFKFHFEETGTVKLLKTKEVCHMLQVSPCFLMKLVKEKSLKSYKLGRLRRFSLEDVLYYLTKNNGI